jgi:hypothetical protein
MPWSPAQHRLFEAAAHSPDIAKRTGIPQDKARKMAAEGIKDKPQKLAALLKTSPKK